jgi:hypothetical protein
LPAPAYLLALKYELINQFDREDFILKKQTTPMTNVISALTARTQFGQILRRSSRKTSVFWLAAAENRRQSL